MDGGRVWTPVSCLPAAGVKGNNNSINNSNNRTPVCCLPAAWVSNNSNNNRTPVLVITRRAGESSIDGQ